MRVPVHFCPFCKARLSIFDNGEWNTYICLACQEHDVMKYRVDYWKYPTRLMAHAFTLDKYYVQISYVNKNIIVSRLEACMLFDSIQINKLIPIDFYNTQDFLNRIKTFLTLS